MMLLQSFGGEISVFPAYPWKNGSFEGFRAEGGFLVSSKMEDGRITRLVAKSLEGERCTVYLDSNLTSVTIVAAGGGETEHSELERNEIGNRVRFSFETQPDTVYDCAVEY